MKSVIVTVIGEDRPGLVERLADVVADHDGNWLESRMSHLAGNFAGIVRLEVPEPRVDDLMRGLNELEASGLHVAWAAGTEETQPRRAVRLELVGTDHSGIVRDVSRALARRGVNVEELNTERTSAPMSGQALFRASATLHLPGDVSLDELRAELELVAHDLMVDLTLQADEADEA